MTVYIVLFRGVGGATQLPVKPLREALSAAGFEDVATYINSGNTVLSSPANADEVVAKIAAIVSKKFGFDKAVYALAREEWAALIEHNPFPDAVSEPKLLHAAVLVGKPGDEKITALRALATAAERIEIVGNVAYLHTPNGFGTSKMAARFDKGIGVPNTARNWNTVTALARMADAIG